MKDAELPKSSRMRMSFFEICPCSLMVFLPYTPTAAHWERVNNSSPSVEEPSSEPPDVVSM
jgi:hypothetical protein